ncbi:MAG: nuclear transport factor 2 family protein [Bacteroidota bacterium]
MKPKELIGKWVELFNEQNSEALAELYHSEAVNHQVNTDPVKGKQAIGKMFKTEFDSAHMTCIIEHIYEDGEWAILEWKDPLGLRGCGFFHVIDNRIVFQRGYWDKLSFLRMHNLPMPTK